MPKLIDETGHVHGQLTVLRRAGSVGRCPAWLCRCTCGREEVVRGQDLRDGVRTACRECGRAKRPRAAHAAERTVFRNMLARCGRPGPYADVAVDPRWLGPGGFERFLADMGPRPPGTTLDRVDGTRGYSPGNCRWADARTQAVNRRSTVFVELDGACAPLHALAAAHGLRGSTVDEQLRRGWAVEQALGLCAPGQVPPVYVPGEGEVLPDQTTVDTQRGEAVAVGDVFGDLRVEAVLRPRACGHPRVLCMCTRCGRRLAVHVRTLLSGHAVGCGCAPAATVNKDRARVQGLVAALGEDVGTRYARAHAVWRAWAHRGALDPAWTGRGGFVRLLRALGLPASTKDQLVCMDSGAVHWLAAGTWTWTAANVAAVMHAEFAELRLRADLTGRTYGRLTVLGLAGRGGAGPMWRCACTCGAEVDVAGRYLTNGGVRSCGCLQREGTRARSTVHGRSRSPERRSFDAMHARCERPGNVHFAAYGGRGIRVCPEWSGEGGFEQFLADVGPRPAGCTLDRVDVDGYYGPGNCRWAPPEVQANNTRRSRRLRISTGEEHTLAEWARLRGLSRGLVADRLRRGWTPDEAVCTVRGR